MASFHDLHDPKSPAYKKARQQHFNSAKNRDPTIEADWTPFRAAEKKYKAKFPPPNLEQVLDLALLDPTRTLEISQGGWSGRSDAIEYTRLATLSQHTAYSVSSIPGLVILPRFLSVSKQKELVKWALDDQSRTNETNLHTHYQMPDSGLWPSYAKSISGDPQDDLIVQPKAIESSVYPSSSSSSPSGPRQLINNEPASVTSFESINTTPKPPSAPSLTVQPTAASALLRKLRWANIGWFYHWGIKQYDFARGKAPIHPSVRDVCRQAVRTVDWNSVYSSVAEALVPRWQEWDEEYEPDAGIVNFYHNKDTLMAHVDRSEVCETSPLVSISLGQAAIFLIGDASRDTPPVGILVRSGDVIIMSGPCRRAYHGIPRILEGTCPLEDVDDPEWKAFSQYLASTRINVNVRQVFPKGFNPFSEGNGLHTLQA